MLSYYTTALRVKCASLQSVVVIHLWRIDTPLDP